MNSDAGICGIFRKRPASRLALEVVQVDGSVGMPVLFAPAHTGNPENTHVTEGPQPEAARRQRGLHHVTGSPSLRFHYCSAAKARSSVRCAEFRGPYSLREQRLGGDDSDRRSIRDDWPCEARGEWLALRSYRNAAGRRQRAHRSAAPKNVHQSCRCWIRQATTRRGSNRCRNSHCPDWGDSDSPPCRLAAGLAVYLHEHDGLARQSYADVHEQAGIRGDQLHGYEIWNEPDGTWTNSMAFTEFWKQTYVKIRALDPTAKIIGPSISYFSSSYLNTFLTYAKVNNCVPDIVAWHELSGGNFTSNYATYRALETQLGIGPLPISINEYSGPDHIDDEGQPGASAPLIAKFERFKVDSACLTFWDVSHPGRLGSLMASNTATNGGWWFYKWYGEMDGNMVTTTPPSPNTPAALDGFANLDASGAKATVLFGGVNDGTIQVVVKGIQAASFFGSNVRAVVEHSPFVNRTTVVTATDSLSTANLAVSNDQISVTVSGANNNDGYRLSLTPVSGGGGGTSSTGGASATGGTRTTGGTSSAGGSKATGGNAGTGGLVAVGGGSASGGSTATGGRVSTGGVTAAGASATAGGSLNAGGSAANGGQSGVGGAGARGGGLTFASGGLGGASATNNAGNATGVVNGDASSDAGGCSCSVPGNPPTSKLTILLGTLGLLLTRARKRRAPPQNQGTPKPPH